MELQNAEKGDRMITNHCSKRLKERNLILPVSLLNRISERCQKDTAVLLLQFDEIKNDSDLNYHKRFESNGDLVFVIVRYNPIIKKFRPVTIMYRRSNQQNTCEKLHVAEIVDIHKSFEKEIKNESYFE